MGNIMYDRRVVRGSTHSQPIIPPSVLAEQQEAAASETKRKDRKTSERKAISEADARARALEVPPVPGRHHNEVRQLDEGGG